MHDHDLIGTKDVSTTQHETISENHDIAALTEEELVVEKKLRRRIDTIILPLIVLVYLMNYIDR